MFDRHKNCGATASSVMAEAGAGKKGCKRQGLISPQLPEVI